MGEFVQGPRLSEQEMQKKLEEVRNGVSKKFSKWADRVAVSMTFTPHVERHEGERWSENGKTWTVKNGIKTSVNPLEAARMPHWCPKCSISMSHRFDRKFYYLRGWCYNCNINFEHELRVAGKWDEYERRLVRENEKAFLRDKIEEKIDYIRTFKVPQIHFEDGRWEEIAPLSSFTGMFEELENDIEFMVSRLEQIIRDEREENNDTTTIA